MAIGTYGELRTQFKALLNRRDCSDALADTFIDQGLSRLMRTLRVPCMEAFTTIGVSADGEVEIPANFLELKGLFYLDKKLVKKELGEWQRLYGGINEDDPTIPNGSPVFYTRRATQWLVKPNPGSAGEVTCWHYVDPNTFDDDADTSPLIDIASDLIIYASLLFAADYFLDERRDAWEATYKMMFGELMDASMQMEAGEGYAAISPSTSCDY